MKPNLWKPILCAICIGASGLVARATPLQRSDVIADPVWLLHVDFDALRPTTIGQFILSQMDRPEAKARLAEFQTTFGFDLRNQIHGITLYGSSQSPQDGILIINGDFDTGRLATLAQAGSNYMTSIHNGHVIQSWTDNKMRSRPGVDSRVYAAVYTNSEPQKAVLGSNGDTWDLRGDEVIMGRSHDKVAQALDVIYGASPSLAGSQAFPELGVVGDTHIIEAAARKMNTANPASNAAIFQLSKSVQLFVDEKQNQFLGTLTLVGENDAAAGQVNSIAQGLLAVMKMQSNNPDAAKLANALTVTQDGSLIVGKLAMPAGDVVEMIKAGAARMASARAAKERENGDW
jgi:hypothetical protein